MIDEPISSTARPIIGDRHQQRGQVEAPDLRRHYELDQQPMPPPG
jgi:hypothetical protein